MSARPRRSLLFMPGTNARAMEKARGLDVDGIILDMEDAVAPDRKAEARAVISEALAQGGFGKRETIVRVNGADTAWMQDDLQALSANSPDAILIPKIYGPQELARLEKAMGALDFPERVAIWAMMETPAAILNAQAIAAAGGRLSSLVVGTNDLSSDLRAPLASGRKALQTALSICVLAARAHRLSVIDGVYTDLEDTAGFAAECAQGRALGFDGKTLVHPGQIEAANKAFGPSENEIVEARRIIAAFEEAQAGGQAVTIVDGKMIEALHVAAARQLLDMALAVAG